MASHHHHRSSLTPPQLNNNNAVLEDVAIDFKELMRQEKKRAREERRKKKIKGTNVIVEAAVVPQQKDTATKSTATNNNNDSSLLDDWPTDWLSTSPSTLPFSFDYITTTPATVSYKRQFLDTHQQARLMTWLQSLPESTSTTTNQQEEVYNTWNTMKYAKRRVCMCAAATTTTSPLPLPLQQLAHYFVEVGIFSQQEKPNHVLINEYTNSQGILSHTDGPMYFPKTATISIGISEVLLYFKKRLASNEIGLVENPVELQVLLESGSLVVFEKDAYIHYTHGIDTVLVEYASRECINAPEETRVSRGHRISLTFRHKYNVNDVE